MTCPEWSEALAWREGDGQAPPGWQSRLEHLAACPACRRQVAELDPTVLLAAAAAPAPPVGETEVGEVASTVRALVKAERLAGRDRPDRRALVAAAALVALLAVPLGLGRLAGPRAAPPPTAPEVATLLPEPPAEPPVEEVQPAGARVYQFGTEELPVVLIFDENLDL